MNDAYEKGKKKGKKEKKRKTSWFRCLSKHQNTRVSDGRKKKPLGSELLKQ